MFSTMPRWKQRTLLGLSLVLGVLFLMSGGSKILGSQMHIESFARWGYPQWFRVVTGLVEASGALLVIASARTRFYGAALLVGTMAGAALTHLRFNELGALPVPIVLFAWAALVAWTYRPEFVRKLLALPRQQPHAV
jgi:putative oxidoreductase